MGGSAKQESPHFSEVRFKNIVIKEYSKFKNISEDDVIDLFNKYGIFSYLQTYFDILKDSRQLFWKIDVHIDKAKKDIE